MLFSILYFILVNLALAGDHDAESPRSMPVHLGIDATVSAPEIETEGMAHGQITFPVRKHIGLSFSGRATTAYYGELYLGPAFRFEQFTFTPSIGLETADMPLRGAASADWANERFHLLGIIEHGGSGTWYHALSNIWLDPIGVGIFAQRFDGIGPWAALQSHHFQFWVAGLYDPEDERLGGIAGLDWSRH